MQAPGAKALVSPCAPFPSSTDARRHHRCRSLRWSLSNSPRPPEAARRCSHCCSTTPQSAFTLLARRQDIGSGNLLPMLLLRLALPTQRPGILRVELTQNVRQGARATAGPTPGDERGSFWDEIEIRTASLKVTLAQVRRTLRSLSRLRGPLRSVYTRIAC